MHWINWETMCTSKFQDGMGLKNLKLFNLAILAKTGWCLLHDSQSLLDRVFKTKYFPSVDFVHSNMRHKPSYVWRSIFAAKLLLLGGCIWRIGKGTRVSILNDKWLPLILLVLISQSIQVTQLINCWFQMIMIGMVILSVQFFHIL